MAYANWRYVNDKTTGRFVLGGGFYPPEKIVAHQGLPTLDTALGTTHPDDPRLETVITMGTVVTAVKDDASTSSGTHKERLAPAKGYVLSGGSGDSTSGTTYDSGGDDTFTVSAESTPVGVAAQHIYRPMHTEYDNHGGMFVAGSAYVEWPIVSGGGLESAAPGDLVTFDESGRPLRVAVATTDGTASATPGSDMIIGRVVATETFANEFDQGLLNHMLFNPKEPVIRHVYEIQASGTNQGTVARANLDTADVLGAARVLLNI